MKKSTCVCLIFLAICLSACQTYNQGPSSAWNGSSQAGTPVKTRLKGGDRGFRFLFIGSSPSEQAALDNLYKSAESAGYKIDGNNYAFQNMYAEQSGILYPLLGFGYLTVTADLYKYEYKGTEYSIKENNSSISSEKTVLSLFDRLF